ncbi:hypothetical protein [Methylopila sp. M107]|uniref:hypothetical protein n=1 Tax=Methylopila sp. M107 TaxID=1101190 RepID=UPI00035DA8C9|nr:hypothetical protein [Methylopila sp. M107]
MAIDNKELWRRALKPKQTAAETAPAPVATVRKGPDAFKLALWKAALRVPAERQ